MNCNEHNLTLGVIVGNREFFPDEQAVEGGRRIIKVLEDEGFEVITPFNEETGEGTAENRKDSKRYSELFKEKIDEIDAVLITLPNFGDEKSLAEIFKLSKLEVPVMIHAFPDEKGKMDRAHRRDSFCGKLSVCNNLNQYGIPFTNTQAHVEDPSSGMFKEDLTFLERISRTVNGLKKARLGVIGVRPNPFQTVRFSEKILEEHGISVENIGLIEIIERSKSIDEEEPSVQEQLNMLKNQFDLDDIPSEAVLKTAKLVVTLSEWTGTNDIDAISLQCWPSMEKYYGIAPCGAMSLLTEKLLPSACESDVMGSLSMYALQLASDNPPALIDINNNYGDSSDKFVAFHCSNFPKSFFGEGKCELGYHEMQEVYGACSGRVAPGPATFLRISTNDVKGEIRSYVAEGEFTDDELETFGGYGVVKIDNLSSLLDHIVDEGFEHHTAVVRGHRADVLEEAFDKYLGWGIYRHSP